MVTINHQTCYRHTLLGHYQLLSFPSKMNEWIKRGLFYWVWRREIIILSHSSSHSISIPNINWKRPFGMLPFLGTCIFWIFELFPLFFFNTPSDSTLVDQLNIVRKGKRSTIYFKKYINRVFSRLINCLLLSVCNWFDLLKSYQKLWHNLHAILYMQFYM